MNYLKLLSLSISQIVSRKIDKQIDSLITSNAGISDDSKAFFLSQIEAARRK